MTELSGVRSSLEGFVLVLEPESPASLYTWAALHRAAASALLYKHGAIVFRGFAVDSLAHFEETASRLAGPLSDYHSIAGPRHRLSAHVSTASDYPPRRAIPTHSEGAYAHRFPERLLLHCRKTPSAGGETPLVDLRRVLGRLSPTIKKRFSCDGLLYITNYADDFGRRWQDAFSVDTKEALDRACTALGASVVWKKNGLRTAQRRPAIVRHPQTGELTWFNQALAYHVSALPKEVAEALCTAYAEEDLPMQSFHGDGQRIEPECIAEIRAATESETWPFQWRAGDVLMIDNLLVAHGRAPYRGERDVIVAMSRLMEWSEVET